MQEDQPFPFPRVRRREEPPASNYGGEHACSNAPILTPPPTESQAGLGPAVPGFSPMSEQERERERDMTAGPNVVIRSSRAARQPMASHARGTSSSSYTSSNEAQLPHQPYSWPDGNASGMMQDGSLPRQNTYPPMSPMSPGIVSSGENGVQSAFAQAANYPPQMQQSATPQMMQMPQIPNQPGGIMPGGPYMNPPMPPAPHIAQQQLQAPPPLYLYAMPPGVPGASDQSPTTNGVPECKFFKLGHCAKGDKCRFIHVPKKED